MKMAVAVIKDVAVAGFYNRRQVGAAMRRTRRLPLKITSLTIGEEKP
jgi:hypothetical protein